MNNRQGEKCNITVFSWSLFIIVYLWLIEEVLCSREMEFFFWINAGLFFFHFFHLIIYFFLWSFFLSTCSFEWNCWIECHWVSSVIFEPYLMMNGSRDLWLERWIKNTRKGWMNWYPPGYSNVGQYLLLHIFTNSFFHNNSGLDPKL